MLRYNATKNSLSFIFEGSEENVLYCHLIQYSRFYIKVVDNYQMTIKVITKQKQNTTNKQQYIQYASYFSVLSVDIGPCPLTDAFNKLF